MRQKRVISELELERLERQREYYLEKLEELEFLRRAELRDLVGKIQVEAA
jgi:hypothetical protein